MTFHRFPLSVVLAALTLSGSTTIAAEIDDLVGGEPVKLVGDCKFTEGPAWHPDGYLLFSDIPNNRIVRVNTDGSSSDWLTDSGGANGLMCNSNGDVFAARMGARDVVLLRTGDDGKGRLVKVLADEYDGKPLNKPNDLALDTQGGLYFTDPNYGQDPPNQPVEGVYYISAAGKITRIVDDLPRPNGILVSPDGKSLLVANINLRQIIKYEIEAPGRISVGRVLFTGDEERDGYGPDGMTFDEHGNIYGAYRAVTIVSPEGELIGRINLPEKPSNCAFGGDDNRTLYVTAQTSLYSVPMKTAGLPIIEVKKLAQADDSDQVVEVKAGELTLMIPKAWDSSPPTSNMRLAQFTIPPAQGDSEAADLVIYPPFGGTIPQNVQRWIGQFASEGRQLKMTQGETKQGKYVLVDLTGTYDKPEGQRFLSKSTPTPGYRMLAVMFSKEGGGNYSFRLTGPKATVGRVAETFRKTFGGDASKEKPYEF